MPEVTQSEKKGALPKLPGNARSGQGLFHFSVAYFLIALVIMIATLPFILRYRGGDFIEDALLTVVFISGVLATGGNRKSLVWAIVLAIPAAVGKWVNL